MRKQLQLQAAAWHGDIKGSRFQAVSSLCILFWCDFSLSWVSGLWEIFVHRTSGSVDDPQWWLQTTDHWPFRFVSEAVVFSTALRNIFFLFCERTQTTLNSFLSCVLSTSYSYMRPNHPYLYLCIYIMFLMFVSHTLPCWFAYRLLGLSQLFSLVGGVWPESHVPWMKQYQVPKLTKTSVAWLETDGLRCVSDCAVETDATGWQNTDLWENRVPQNLMLNHHSHSHT